MGKQIWKISDEDMNKLLNTKARETSEQFLKRIHKGKSKEQQEYEDEMLELFSH